MCMPFLAFLFYEVHVPLRTFLLHAYLPSACILFDFSLRFLDAHRSYAHSLYLISLPPLSNSCTAIKNHIQKTYQSPP